MGSRLARVDVDEQVEHCPKAFFFGSCGVMPSSRTPGAVRPKPQRRALARDARMVRPAHSATATLPEPAGGVAYRPGLPGAFEGRQPRPPPRTGVASSA